MPREAGLFVYTRLREGLVVVPQRRGLVNIEGDWKPMPFPNLFQPTCVGTIGEDESPEEAIVYEGSEVLDFDLEDRPLTLLTDEHANDPLYGILLERHLIEEFRLHPSTGGLAPMALDVFMRTVQCVPRRTCGTFPSIEQWGMVHEEWNAVLEGFNKFKDA